VFMVDRSTTFDRLAQRPFRSTATNLLAAGTVSVEPSAALLPAERQYQHPSGEADVQIKIGLVDMAAGLAVGHHAVAVLQQACRRDRGKGHDVANEYWARRKCDSAGWA
jgi:hypothetical protein